MPTSTVQTQQSGGLLGALGITGLVNSVTQLVPAIAPVALAKYQVDQQNANLAQQQATLTAQVQQQQAGVAMVESNTRQWFVIGGVVLLAAVVLGFLFRRR
ncbi:MAG: hypothetical protein H3C27_08575 [Opitutaceae bacterium]|nr:hypothetical protein [Opitutaceae bacterium]